MTEYVYLNRNNPLSFTLKEDGVAIGATDMSVITKVGIQYKGHYYTSASFPSSFDYATYAADSKIVAYLGTLDLEVGRDYQSELIIWGSGYPDGLVWDTIDIEVIDETAADPSLIVEDGSLASDSANTYIDVDYLNTYCNNRGYPLSNATPVSKKQAILRGMNYIESRNWKGRKTNRDNPCTWPRAYIYDRDDYIVDTGTIPDNVQKAQAEASYQEHEELGTLDHQISRNGPTKRKKIGPLETEWFEGSKQKSVVPVINRLLFGYIEGSGSVTMVRS